MRHPTTGRPVRTTTLPGSPLCAGASTADGPANQLQLGDLLLAGSNPPPERGGLGQGWQIQLYNVRVRLFLVEGEPGWADMKKGALRPLYTQLPGKIRR